MTRILILFFIISFCNEASTQFNKAIFEWESHLPRKIGRNVTQSSTHIFYQLDNNLVKIDKEEYSVEFFSKVDGLSDVELSTVAYNQSNELLIIAYQSGNIDLLFEDGSIVNIPDLLLNQILTGNKTINHIYTQGNRALLACSFGVLEIDLLTFNSGFTTNMNLNVMDILVDNEFIYAATEEGIFRYNEETGLNPGFFGQWEFLGSAFELPELYEARAIEVFQNQLFAIVDNSLYSISPTATDLVLSAEENRELVFIKAASQRLLIGDVEDYDGRLASIESDMQVTEWVDACASVITSAIQDQYGTIWYTDRWHGIKYQESYGGSCGEFDFDSPYETANIEIRLKNSEVYVASGGINENFLFDYYRNGFYVKRNNSWTNYNENSLPIIGQNDMYNFVVAQPHPSKNVVFAGAFPGGLLELNMDTKEATVHNHLNSPIKGPTALLESERVSDIAFDQDENMWVTCFLAEEGLVVRTPEGEWASFRIGNVINLADIEVDDFGYLWIRLGASSGGVVVYNHKNTILDASDDEYVILNRNSVGLESNRIISLEKDHSGDIWIGTDQGPAIYDSGDPFFGLFPVTYKIVEEDNIPAILLETEYINSITVDGGNRKWFGTSNGVFVQTADGELQVHRYNTENSPLFSDNVIDMAYDPIVGEIYLATEQGLQSIRIESTGASQKFQENEIYVFPNPVRPEYSGLIAIKGLANNCNVKIADVAGNIVHESESVGGMATWDGRDLSGNPVSAGVYQVFATSASSTEIFDTATCKFVVVR